MSSLTLTLLGGFQAQAESELPLQVPSRKAQALLAYLAVTAGSPHSREKLAALLWGDVGDRQARDSLRHTIADVRRTLSSTAPDVLLIQGDLVGLSSASVEVDVIRFQRLLGEGSPAALEQAVDLYRGELLEGLVLDEAPFEAWLGIQRECLHESALEAFAKLLQHQLLNGPPALAIQTACRLLALDELQEAIHRTLMRLYSQQGRLGMALRQYQLCLEVMQRELGIEPEEETRALYRDILRQRPARVRFEEMKSSSGEVATQRAATACVIGGIAAPDMPLVGRDDEIAQLRHSLHAAWAGSGRGVLLIGEAGIGKSRMLQELALEAAQQGGRVLIGRCYETEQLLPFEPWVTAFRSSDGSRSMNIDEALGRASRIELCRLFPELKSRGDEPVGPANDRLLFEAVFQFIAHLTTVSPLVLILEDLHWADEMSVRLLAFLVRRLHALPILVIGAVREEELADGSLLRRTLDELIATERLDSIELSGLSELHTRRLVRLMQTEREAIAREQLGAQVWAMSEGNPFVVVEMMRALREGSTADLVTDLELPQRVRHVVAGRLQRLGEESRSLVAVAAVIGREFDFAVLSLAARIPEAAAATRVEELVRRRILRGVGDRLDFAHDWIRTVMYESLLPLRRRLLHRQVGEALEVASASDLDSVCAALGFHYREAEAWRKAAAYLRRAGRQAMARSAYSEAAALFEQATKVLAHLPSSIEVISDAIDVRLDLYGALLPAGIPGRVLDTLREAEALIAAVDDPQRETRLCLYLSEYSRSRRIYGQAIAYGERALRRAADFDDMGMTAQANFQLGMAQRSQNEYDAAIDRLRECVKGLEGDLEFAHFGLACPLSIAALGHLAMALSTLGEFAEGARIGEKAIRTAEVVDKPFGRVEAYRALTFVRVEQGNVQQAVPLLEKSLELCKLWHIELQFAWLAAWLGYAYALQGRLDDAVPPLHHALEQRMSIRGEDLGESGEYLLSVLAEGHLLAGRSAEATFLAHRALELARQHQKPVDEARALRLLGEIAAQEHSPNLDEAEDRYRQSRKLAEPLGVRPLVAHCSLGLGILYGRSKRLAKARVELTTALAAFSSLDMPFWVARAEAELAKIAVQEPTLKLLSLTKVNQA